MPKSAYLRTRLVKHAVGNSAFTMPAGAYLALFTTDPTINATGTEVVGGSYARQSISWGTEANGRIPSNAITSFTNMPATTVTHWAVYDASTSGNMLYYGSFEVPIVRTAGQTLAIASGNVAVSEE